MPRVQGKVALITGAARGQGRSHAQRLAEEGADIIAVDICGDIDSIPYEMATPDDLKETVRLVEAEDRRIMAREADVRDQGALDAIVKEALEEFGKIDIVCANAGVCVFAPLWEHTEDVWVDEVEIMMGGVWRTVKAVVPHMIERKSGSIIITSSLGGIKGLPGVSAYSAAKFGNVGMAQSLAAEVGQYNIRVNTVHPTNVDTGMINNDHIRAAFRPDLEHPTKDDFAEAATPMNLIPVPWVEPRDISNAVLFLASDESRYVTGLRMTVDAGASIK